MVARYLASDVRAEERETETEKRVREKLFWRNDWNAEFARGRAFGSDVLEECHAEDGASGGVETRLIGEADRACDWWDLE